MGPLIRTCANDTKHLRRLHNHLDDVLITLHLRRLDWTFTQREYVHIMHHIITQSRSDGT